MGLTCSNVQSPWLRCANFIYTFVSEHHVRCHYNITGRCVTSYQYMRISTLLYLLLLQGYPLHLLLPTFISSASYSSSLAHEDPKILSLCAELFVAKATVHSCSLCRSLKPGKSCFPFLPPFLCPRSPLPLCLLSSQDVATSTELDTCSAHCCTGHRTFYSPLPTTCKNSCLH